jgi:cellulose synthase/poly-beta-1,6-N-acetylglucosamine synthase-like glycosyltransferase
VTAGRGIYRAVATSGGALVATGWLGLHGVVLVLSVALQLLFIAYFVRHLAFAITAMRAARADIARDADGVDADYEPSVSVLVACRNEQSVVGRLLDALLQLDYPPERLEVVVVDDRSSDRTGALLDARAGREPHLHVVHRDADATGGKSAALNDGFAHTRGEIVVVFDADHEPRPDVIRKLVRHFRDPAVGAVQGRCAISNPDDSLLARLVWMDYLAGYLVNEFGRQSLFQLPAYGGANCAVRAATLSTLGGWNESSVTEDTDLTMRVLLHGLRVRYDVEAVDDEEGVVTLGRYWHQRYRWARGHQQVCRDYRRAVWRSTRLSAAEKTELMMFLFVFHVPVAAAAGLGIFALWILGLAHPFSDAQSFVFWTLLFLGPLLELGGGLVIDGAPRRSARTLVFFIPLFFVSIALCTKAWWDGTRAASYTWHKTPRRDVVEVAA